MCTLVCNKMCEVMESWLQSTGGSMSLLSREISNTCSSWRRPPEKAEANLSVMRCERIDRLVSNGSIRHTAGLLKLLDTVRLDLPADPVTLVRAMREGVR